MQHGAKDLLSTNTTTLPMQVKWYATRRILYRVVDFTRFLKESVGQA